MVNYLLFGLSYVTQLLRKKNLEYYESLCWSDVSSEIQKCRFSCYTIDFCFDPEQLPCALIIHSANRIVNYLLFGLSYVTQLLRKKI